MTSATQKKQLLGIVHLLGDEMGMSSSAAASVGWRWQKSHSKTAFVSTLLDAAIQHQIDIYRSQTFAKFNMDIAVYPADNALPIVIELPQLGEVTIGYQYYKFDPRHNDERKKCMQLRLSCGCIQVRFCRQWQPIAAYLDQISTQLNYELPQQFALDRQFSWWKTTGKAFRIMDLPGELRNTIYDHVFPTEAQPFPTSKCRKLRPFGFRAAHSPHTALMRTNKRIYSEASDRFYLTTPFLIEHASLLNRTLKNRLLQQRLRHLRLSLTHGGYLGLFSFDEGPATYPATYATRCLREINLDSLEVCFSPPSRIASRTWLEGACQRTVVDLIVKAAWLSIKGHPVTITGYVKASQKREFESRLEEEKALFDKWAALKIAGGGGASTLLEYDDFMEKLMEQEHGGVRLDGEAWREEESASLPLQNLEATALCSCKTKCTLERWTAND